MNTIDVQPVTTLYGYSESYWLIDGKPIVRYLDEYVRDGKCPALERFGSLLGLLPAWSGELEWAAENRFIWEMIDSPGTLNVPILVCEDDCDLSCIVILARIRKTEDFIFWDKIGLLLHENEDFDLEQRAGIANLDSYSEEDWEGGITRFLICRKTGTSSGSRMSTGYLQPGNTITWLKSFGKFTGRINDSLEDIPQAPLSSARLH